MEDNHIIKSLLHTIIFTFVLTFVYITHQVLAFCILVWCVSLNYYIRGEK